MLPELLQKTNLFQLLHRIDKDLCRRHWEQGCPYCGYRLNQSNYVRKPRGGPGNIPEEYAVRQSLCCARDGCRKRTLPPSCLFMGRRVYWGCVILVVVALRQHRTEGASIGKLVRLFGISRKTITRWIRYFQEIFCSGPTWRRVRGLVPATVGNEHLPGDLLFYLIECGQTPRRAVVACLELLAQ